MPGIPVGPGTVFYLLAALLTPFVRRGRPGVTRQAGIALGMVCTGALSLWVFNRVGQAIDGHHASVAFLLSSPLLVALLVLAAMTILSRLARKISR